VTKGSWVHDDVSRHLAACAQCREVDPENRRRKHDKPGQVSERDVPAETFAAMCPDGRAIYRSYLSWLAEPE
jgi:hypothetical protein